MDLKMLLGEGLGRFCIHGKEIIFRFGLWGADMDNASSNLREATNDTTLHRGQIIGGDDVEVFFCLVGRIEIYSNLNRSIPTR